MVARGGFYSVYGNDDEMDAFRSFNHPHVMGGRGMRGLFNPQRLVRVQRKQVEVVGLRLYQLLAFIAGRPDRTNTLFTETPLRVLTATAAEEPFSSPLHRTDGSPTGARDRGRPSAGSQERTPQDQIAARSDSGSRRGMRPHIPPRGE
ncbi:hypothetical protein AGDE_17213 [Angomonas deanei]|nr:hypothetical protein AGDE_17213 [Angomonas deanei]|eukprot:EPY15032.1 hypothetical protein AGDE_17213 [Angomonas deanei]